MKNNTNCSTLSNYGIACITLFFCGLLIYPAGKVSGSSSDTTDQSEFVITGKQYYRHNSFDTGEICIFLKNSSEESLSINQCKLYKVIENKEQKNPEIKYLYAKLSPPELAAGNNGELLIKLNKTLPENSKVNCIIEDNTGTSLETSILVKQVPIWIPYVGFSEELNEIYIYIENNCQKPLKVKLIEVADINVGNNYRSINNDLDANDKGCLIYKLPRPVKSGQYVNVVVSAESENKKWQTHRIVRAVKKFPLLLEKGGGNWELGLDSEEFFVTSTFGSKKVACVQNMICPAHQHGTYGEAAKKFLDNRHDIFLQATYLLTQMRICRSNKPRAWFKFGGLADISVMNTVLSGSVEDESFCPFFGLGVMAKKSAEPNRYFACIPVSPENILFVRSNYTPNEIKFLVYCAVAGGAKGLLYRGVPILGDFVYDTFVRLNKELQELKPLLIISEPVDWASTADDNYVAKSLLCGDEAILVFVFDRRYFSKQQRKKFYTPVFAKAAGPTKIEVKIPDRFAVSNIESQYQRLAREQWNYQQGEVDFTIQISDSVQTYKVVLAQSSLKTGLKGKTEPCKNKAVN
ncbi:hypothetical protein ACFL3G_08760 [Planctomycetota bacterium]